jgi:hypothetical protein
MDSERRNAPRHHITADAEVIEFPSNTKHRARTSDLSSSGCFLDMMNPSTEGKEIVVRIFHAKTTFTAAGTVVFVIPHMGMGVVFTSIEDDQLLVLKKWLSK